MQQDVRESAQRLGENAKMENGTANAVNSFYLHLQSNMFERNPVGTHSTSQHLRLKPLVTSSVEPAVQSGNADMGEPDYPPHVWQGTAIKSIAKAKPTFLVEAKGVSRNLVKAIVKPTVSHIADAYNKFEVCFPTIMRSSHLSLSYSERSNGSQGNTKKRSIKGRYGHESGEKCRLRLCSRLWKNCSFALQK